MNLRRIAAGLGAALGLAGVSTAPVLAQSVPAADAPAKWVAYAETVSEAVSGWLEEDGESSLAARGYLGAARYTAEGQPLVLRIWISADGGVERVTFPPFVEAEAGGALRDALVGRILPGPPPPDMLQPLRIAVEPGD